MQQAWSADSSRVVNGTYDAETETRPRRSRPRLQPWTVAIHVGLSGLNN